MPDPLEPSNCRTENILLFATGFGVLIILAATGNRYGFHRDELATLEDARHLAWGYVAYPPVTPFFGRLSLELFGTSLLGFRFFAALAQSLSVMLAGLIARELGAKAYGQLLAATATLPFALAAGSLMQYVAFDALWWVLCAYFVVRMLCSHDERWWLAIGATIGVGALTKYSIAILGVSLALGLVFSGEYRRLRSKWPWLGVALSLLIFLPNLVWQVRHDYISLDFLRHIHERDVRIGRTDHFLADQLKLCLLAFPLAMAGAWFYFFRAARQLRSIGWMYVLALLFFIAARGRGYYLAGAYPMLYAAGSFWFETRAQCLADRWKKIAVAAASVALALNIAVVAVFVLPLAPPGTPWFRSLIKARSDLAEEIGWPEMVAEVARIRDSLSPAEQGQLGILAANYGEAGAINLYGPERGLPRAISGINSFWAQGYPDPAPQVLIVLGFSPQFRERNFTTCSLAGRSGNPYKVENEETRDHPEIFVCRGLRRTWPEFWGDFRYFG